MGRLIRDQIAARDGWDCWLCRQPIDPFYPPDLPLSPTVDHVKAYAEGGSSQLHNLKLAHKHCNNMRSNAVDE